jgi:hypothetical protein
VVLAWLTDTSVGWSELVRRMKAWVFKDRFKGGSLELEEKNERDWVTQRLPGRTEPAAQHCRSQPGFRHRKKYASRLADTCLKRAF